MPNDAQHPEAGTLRIVLDDPGSMSRWSKELNVTAAQLREAVAAVGDAASDVEMHLKGSRSSTDEDLQRRS